MAAKTPAPVPPPTPVPSVVTVGPHPLHPMLVVFPMALLIAALAADALYWWYRDAFFARGAQWLIGAGLGVGLIAAAAGFVEFVSIRYAREQISGWSHMLAAILSLSLATANFLLRWNDPVAGVLPWGLLLSADTALMLVCTGWLGGNLTFRHLIGSYVEEEERLRAGAELKTVSPSRESRSR